MTDQQTPNAAGAGARGAADEPFTVRARINYLGAMTEKPLFHAQDHGRDNIHYDPHEMAIVDGRTLTEPPSLDREGLQLVNHRTAIADLRDQEAVDRLYGEEIERLLMDLTGASKVVALKGALMRFAPRSPDHMSRMNSQVARFPHIDFTQATAPGLAESFFGAAAAPLKPGQRLVGYNVWRVASPPPQDIPLAVCDRRTVDRADLGEADGVYDKGEPPWPTLEAFLLRHNPAHRWIYFSNMQPDEALVFRAYGNEEQWIAGAPHCAFADPNCPPEAGPRISVESRGYAIFDA